MTHNVLNVLCLHHGDLDGRCSAAVVCKAFGGHVQCHEMDYGSPVPWDRVAGVDLVVIVDYSLEPADMRRLVDEMGYAVIWLDHHKTAIEKLEGFDYLEGLRDVTRAGCELTWVYFFSRLPVPDAVRYVGDRDLWQFKYPNSKAYCEGLGHHNLEPMDRIWEDLLEDNRHTESLLEWGELLLEAKQRRIAATVERSAYPASIWGQRCLAVNAVGSGDLGEYMRSRGYDIALCYHETMVGGELMVRVTLYSDTVDVSDIARWYGGGGHKGAAGFTLRRVQRRPWIPVVLGSES